TQALLVGLEVDEVERIGGAEAAVDHLVAGVEELVEALARADFEVVLALGTDVEVGCEVGIEDGLAAAGTLGPEAFGADSFFFVPISLGAFELAVLAFEPGHRASVIVYATCGGAKRRWRGHLRWGQLPLARQKRVGERKRRERRNLFAKGVASGAQGELIRAERSRQRVQSPRPGPLEWSARGRRTRSACRAHRRAVQNSNRYSSAIGSRAPRPNSTRVLLRCPAHRFPRFSCCGRC